MNVFVECNPDEILAVSLGVRKKILTHSNDKGRVCNSLEKKVDSVGMIDEDPESSQPTYISKLKFVEEHFKVKVLYDKKSNNKLIIIRPRLEEWILISELLQIKSPALLYLQVQISTSPNNGLSR